MTNKCLLTTRPNPLIELQLLSECRGLHFFLRQKWTGDKCSSHWIEDDLIYHEGCAVLTGTDEIKLWDASAGWWVNPKQFGGYGGVLALKVFAPPGAISVFKWGTHLIEPNCWREIERARAAFAAEDVDEGAAVAAHA